MAETKGEAGDEGNLADTFRSDRQVVEDLKEQFLAIRILEGGGDDDEDGDGDGEFLHRNQIKVRTGHRRVCRRGGCRREREEGTPGALVLFRATSAAPRVRRRPWTVWARPQDIGRDLPSAPLPRACLRSTLQSKCTIHTHTPLVRTCSCRLSSPPPLPRHASTPRRRAALVHRTAFRSLSLLPLRRCRKQKFFSSKVGGDHLDEYLNEFFDVADANGDGKIVR